MNSRFGLLLLALFSTLLSFAQTPSGKLTGKVLNEKNEPLASVSVKVTGMSGGATSNADGTFSLTLPVGKKYELEFSAVGYAPKLVSDVEVKAGQINELNIVLEVKAATGENVIITASRGNARKETAAALIAFQKNTNTVASVISAEAIRRSPDKNTGEVLKRIPGASIQEGRFIVIRGLADRYNQAMLNGILLTSTEPDRKTFSFDLIPSAMIDNIVINKAFVPEYPGEWAGGLIQVNTKDIPSRNFLNIQVGTGFNSQTMGKDFYKDNRGKLDWLGIDDGARALPSGYTTKSAFDMLSPAEKTALGAQMPNRWSAEKSSAPINVSFQANGGFTTKIFGKKTLGGTFGINYSKSNKFIKILNRTNTLANNIFSINYSYDDDRYLQEIQAGAIGSLSLQLNANNRISLKSLINVNTGNGVVQRNGIDYTRNDDVTGSSFTFNENTFFTTQVNGEHGLTSSLKLKWYGSFNILDGYSPDQRRLLYTRTTGTQDPFRALISNSLSQQSGSRTYQELSDYIYTAGGDLSYSFNWLQQKQTLKGGYMFQVKDRLYDAKLFANYFPTYNPALALLPPDQIFAPQNFGNGSDNKFAFDAIKSSNFRYMANTILNAGFVQLDNQFTSQLRVVWGLRVEDYDQLVGSVKTWDPRHTHQRVTDFLPGLNATYKLNNKTNLRLSGSQTVIRPELRELSFLNLYDFELNASVQGLPTLKRSKVTNLDLRYELYPRSGETFSLGVFYKHFKDPIEAIFNEGSGGASTFNFQNPRAANSYGAEAELRKRLDFVDGLKNFTFQANVAYIHSRISDSRLAVDRPLQGQSPYLVNVGLLYDLEKAGFNATLLFNQIGERIYLAGDISAGAGSPDIYEAPRPLLDLQLAKKMMKNKAEIRLNIADILNQTQYFYQNASGKTSFQKGEDAYRFTRKPGTNYSITFNYSL